MRTFASLILFFSLACVALRAKDFKPSVNAPLNATVQKWTEEGSFLFEENKGQMMDDQGNPAPFIYFKFQVTGADIYLTDKGLTYVMLRPEVDEEGEENLLDKDPRKEVKKIKYARADMDLKNARIRRENMVAEFPSEDDRRYFYPHCPQGITGVRRYKKVTVRNIYPGIDWVLYRNEKGQVKYDFVIAPGADPALIQMDYRWARVKTKERKQLLSIHTPLGEILEGSVVSYCGTREVGTRYKITGNTVSFETETYDRSLPLIIDPPLQLVWSSLYGGNNNAITFSTACDAAGNFFVTGGTASTNFPLLNPGGGAYFQGTYNGNGDACFLKFSSTGVPLWATYFGGSNDDRGYSIFIDPSGNVCVAGYSGSTDFPLLDPGGGAYFQNVYGGGSRDACVLKFTNTGALLWSTYYGGLGWDEANSIVTNSAGDIYVVGLTTSDVNFPLQNAGGAAYYQPLFGGGTLQDLFLLRFGSAGSRIHATYYGGNSYDMAHSMTADAAGNIFVTGYTRSTNLPTLNPGAGAYFSGTNNAAPAGGFNAFILKFNSAMQQLWATYMGGNTDDRGSSLAADAGGNIFVMGYTASTNFPTLNPGGGAYYQAANAGSYDMFIAKFNTVGVLIWSTYYGGTYFEGSGFSDHAVAIDKSGCGGFYIAFCPVFYAGPIPTMDPGGGVFFQGASGGLQDWFFAHFSSNGNLAWATYFGGAGYDDVVSIALSPLSNDLFFAGDGGGLMYTAGNYATFPTLDPGGGAYFQSLPGNFSDHPALGKFQGVTPVLVATAGVNAACGNNNGTATASGSGGVPAYSYLWSTTPAQTNATASGLSAGTYTVTITDALGCTKTANVLITNSTGPSVTLSHSNILCNGGSNGTATAIPAGGTPSYTYVWSTTPQQSNAVATGLSAGNYSVIISDSNGCSSTASASITQPAALSVSVALVNPNCNSGTGSANATAVGGTPAYIYSWTPSGGNTPIASGLSAGTYSVLVTDNNSCTAIQTITVTQPAAITSTVTVTQASCGNNIGTASVNVAGGTGNYTYVWSSLGGNSSTASGLAVGSYTCTITDANGCSAAAIANVTSSGAPVIALASQTNVLCYGASNGAAAITASSGSPGYIYSWSPAGGNSPAASGLAAGNYIVTVTDAVGCSNILPVTITQPVSLSASTSAVNPKCNGGTGSAMVTAGGGTPSYVYAWIPSGGNSSTAPGLQAGSYSVVITDSNACSVIQTISIVQPAVISSSVTVTQASCGNNIGTASVNASGGTGNYTYSWSAPGGNSALATGLGVGSYSCTITDANGCSLVAIANVTSSGAPSINLVSQTNISCNGYNNGAASVTASGGSPNYTFNWSPTGGSSASATGLSVGNYIVTVTDGNGCSNILPLTITQPPLLNTSVTITPATCGNNSGTANVIVSGGSGTYTYSWSPSGGNSSVATGLGAGNYSCIIQDGNGCSTAQSTVIANSNGPSVLITSQSNPGCYGGMNGSASSSASGGTAPYTYSWSSTPVQNTANASGLAAGTYIVTVTDASGCSNLQSVTITQPSAITTSVTGTTAHCGKSDGTALVLVSGGASPYSYLWNNSQLTSSATGLAAGNYLVTITDGNGCTATAATTIASTGGPTALAGTSTVISSGGSAALNSQGGTVYLWSPPQGLSCITCANPTASPAQTTHYCVTVTDANGCSDSACVTITVQDPCSHTWYLPNAFSPDGNNENEILRLFTEDISCIREYRLVLYDRWGEKVFETHDPAGGWDGKMKGEVMDSQVLSYLLHLLFTDGTNINRKGNISLIR